MTDNEQELYDRGYIEGQRRMYLAMLSQALAGLGIDSPEWTANRWAAERAEVVAMLRRECEEFGDNDWADTLHLSDVIEKHLLRYWPDTE